MTLFHAPLPDTDIYTLTELQEARKERTRIARLQRDMDALNRPEKPKEGIPKLCPDCIDGCDGHPWKHGEMKGCMKRVAPRPNDRVCACVRVKEAR